MQFQTEDQFYRPSAGRYGGECDYGCFWTGQDGTPGWRVTLVERTGEVYAFSRGQYLLLGDLGHPVADYQAEVDPLLPGWAEKCLARASVEWVARRLHGHGYKTEEHAAKAWFKRTGRTRYGTGLGWLRLARVLRRLGRIDRLGGAWRIVGTDPLPTLRTEHYAR